MKRKIALLCAALAALICEVFPYGAVCVFANFEGEPYRYTYSYFDLTPFGYANFAPLITALLTCVLLFFILLALLTARPPHICVRFLALGTTALSLAPLLLGTAYFTWLGGLITLALAAITILAWLPAKRTKIPHTQPPTKCAKMTASSPSTRKKAVYGMSFAHAVLVFFLSFDWPFMGGGYMGFLPTLLFLYLLTLPLLVAGLSVGFAVLDLYRRLARTFDLICGGIGLMIFSVYILSALGALRIPTLTLWFPLPILGTLAILLLHVGRTVYRTHKKGTQSTKA